MAKDYYIYNSQYPIPESVKLSEIIEVEELPEAAESTPIYHLTGEDTYWHCEYDYKKLTIPNTDSIAWSKIVKRINVNKRTDLPSPADDTAVFYIREENQFTCYNGIGWDDVDEEVIDIDYDDWASIISASRYKLYRIKYNVVTEDGTFPHYYLFRGANVIVPNNKWIKLTPQYDEASNTRDKAANFSDNTYLFFTAALPSSIYETWSANFFVKEAPAMVTATNSTVQIVGFDLPNYADYNRLYYRAFDHTFWHYEVGKENLTIPTMKNHTWMPLSKLYSAMGGTYPSEGSEDTLYYATSIDDTTDTPSTYSYDLYMTCPSINEVEYGKWYLVTSPDNNGLYTIQYETGTDGKHIFSFFAKSKVFVKNGWALLYNTERTITDRNDLRILDLDEDTVYYDSNNRMFGYSQSYQEQIEWVIDGDDAINYDLYGLPSEYIETDKIYHLKPEVGNTHWHYLNNIGIGPDEIVGLHGVAYKRQAKKAYTSECPGDLHTTYVSQLYPTEVDKYYFKGEYIVNTSATRKLYYSLLNNFVKDELAVLLNPVSTGSRVLYNPSNNSTVKIVYNEFETNYDGWVEITNYTEPYTQAEYELRAQHDNTKVYLDNDGLYHFFCHSGLMMVTQSAKVTVNTLPLSGDATKVYYNKTNNTYWHYEFSEAEALDKGYIPAIPVYKYTVNNYYEINGLTDLYKKETLESSDDNIEFLYYNDNKTKVYRPLSDDREEISLTEVTAWPSIWTDEEAVIRFKFEDSYHNIGYRCFRGVKKGTGSDNEGYYNYDAATQTLTISMDDPGSWTHFDVNGTTTPFADAVNATNVIIEDDIYPTNLSHWFEGFTQLTTISNISKIHTQRTTNTSCMFKGCQSLAAIDLTAWDVTRLVNVSSMFEGCIALADVDISSWNTSRISNLSSMFKDCSSLVTIDLDTLKLTTATDMTSMFENCAKLRTLDMTDWDTVSVVSMASMFKGCSALELLKAKNLKFSNCTTVNNMFANCKSLVQIVNDNWGATTSLITDFAYMFSNCSKLLNIVLEDWDTSSATTFANMFNNCSTLRELDLLAWNTTNITNMENMFGGCSSLISLIIYDWDIYNVTNFRDMFVKDSKLSVLNIKGWVMNADRAKDLEEMFCGCSHLTKIYCNPAWHITNTTGLRTFEGCTVLSGAIPYSSSAISVQKMTPTGYLTIQN